MIKEVKTMIDKETLSFESATARLEEIVKILEKGSVSLDESLKLYEEGVSLVRYCNNALDNAERKIKILSVNTDNSAKEIDFLEEN